MKKKKPLAVVIPTYKEKLDILEERRIQISMSHLDADMFFVGPESLERGWYAKALPGIHHAPFPDYDFASRRRYSRWMMKRDLYEYFSEYEFILLCQTDAVVTKEITTDTISSFSFDFVGAPWVPGFQVSWNPLSREVNATASRLTRRWVTVGNGGLSLRRVKAFQRATRRLPRIRSRENEDKVFSYFSRLIGLSVARLEVAENIFMEQGARSWQVGQPIPDVYGFHALGRFNPALEKEIFAHFN